jgi:hypothetical protein
MTGCIELALSGFQAELRRAMNSAYKRNMGTMVVVGVLTDVEAAHVGCGLMVAATSNLASV